MKKDEIEKILTYENLYDLYHNQLKTIYEIEEITKIGHTTISKYLDILNIDKITVTERNLMKNKNIKLTDIQNQVVNGVLLGDGGLRTRTKQRNYPNQTLSLATNNFKKECIEDILVPQLSIFDAYIESTANKEQYLITIPRRKIEDFLDYIGECPFDDYKYKWNVIPYQRTKANDSIIIDLYNNGYTYTEMQRITGCGRTTLVTHIKDLKDKNIVIGRHD